MLCRIFFLLSFVSTDRAGARKAMGLGWQLLSRPFGCTTGPSLLQISIRRALRLASDCPCQVLHQRNNLCQPVRCKLRKLHARFHRAESSLPRTLGSIQFLTKTLHILAALLVPSG